MVRASTVLGQWSGHKIRATGVRLGLYQDYCYG